MPREIVSGVFPLPPFPSAAGIPAYPCIPRKYTSGHPVHAETRPLPASDSELKPHGVAGTTGYGVKVTHGIARSATPAEGTAWLHVLINATWP
jgi:hypothetical protein